MKEKIAKIADIITEYSIYGIIFFIPIAPAALEIFFGFGFLAFIIKKSLKPDFKFFKNTTNTFILFFLIFCAFSLLNSGIYMEKSLKALFFKWTQKVILFFMIVDTFNERRRVINGLVIFLSIAFFAGIDAITQRFLGIEFFRGKLVVELANGMRAARAAFSHYNDFGAYLIFPLTLSLAILTSKEAKNIYKFITLILTIFLTSALFLTLSRGTWLGFLLALILMLILKGRFKALSIAILLLVAVVALFPDIRDRVLLTFQKGGDAGRFTIWKAALQMIKDNPFFGKGIGTFMDYSTKYITTSSPVYAHNCYLQIWAETGIFSLVSFLLFACSLLISGAKAFISRKDFWLLGLLCGTFGFFAHSFFDTQFYSLQLSFLFWTMAGLLSALI